MTKQLVPGVDDLEKFLQHVRESGAGPRTVDAAGVLVEVDDAQSTAEDSAEADLVAEGLLTTLRERLRVRVLN